MPLYDPLAREQLRRNATLAARRTSLDSSLHHKVVTGKLAHNKQYRNSLGSGALQHASNSALHKPRKSLSPLCWLNVLSTNTQASGDHPSTSSLQLTENSRPLNDLGSKTDLDNSEQEGFALHNSIRPRCYTDVQDLELKEKWSVSPFHYLTIWQ